MTFLPVVGRELREASRRRSAYWIRLQAAMIALAIGAFLLLSEWERVPQTLGQMLFGFLAAFVFVETLLVGAWRTSDCISQEKRDGTLGLLFLTDLKGYDIVFGKLAATSLNVFYGLLAVFPVMAIPLLLGGVSFGQFGRVVLVALNNLFFSLAVGLLASALCRDERRSLGLALLILFMVTAFLPLIGLGFTLRKGNPDMPVITYVPSPGYTCVTAFDDVRMGLGKHYHFVESLLCVHGMAWICLGIACVLVPRLWQERALKQANTPRRANRDEAQRQFRHRLLSLNAYYWLAARPRAKAWLVWVFLLIVAVLWFLAWRRWRRDWVDPATFAFTAFVLHTMLKVWLTSESVRRLAHDTKSGALELILSTPLKVRDLLQGQLAALWRQFAAPAAVVLLVDLAFLLRQRNDDAFPSLVIAGMVVFVADMFTLSWLGMWSGLRHRGFNKALAWTLAWILVLPWVVFWVSVVLLTVLSRMVSGTILHSNGNELVWYWVILSLLIDTVFISRAWRGLHGRFRELAAHAA